jgi:hypothetical protein
LGDANACRQGETCSSINGQDVCVPSAVGNQCTACTASGTCNNSQLDCYAQRCYLTCNINSSGHCPTCVQTDVNGNGLCACDDQIVGAGQRCGSLDIAYCQPGTLCVESVCHSQCDPKASPSTCDSSQTCQPYADSSYCLAVASQGGGQGGGGTTGGGQGGGGGSPPDAGAGPGPVRNPALCGCTSFGQASLLGPLFLLALAWRRKPAQRRT